jgi:hypothetical protein
MKNLIILLILTAILSAQTVVTVRGDANVAYSDRVCHVTNITIGANSTNVFAYGGTNFFRVIGLFNDGAGTLLMYLNGLPQEYHTVFAGEKYVYDRSPFTNFVIVNRTASSIATRFVVTGRLLTSAD